MQFNVINSRACVSAQFSEKVRERRAPQKKTKKKFVRQRMSWGGIYVRERGPMPISVEFKEEGKTKYIELIRIPYILID